MGDTIETRQNKKRAEGDGGVESLARESQVEHKPLPVLGIALTLLFATAAFFSGVHVGSDGENSQSLFAAPRSHSDVDLNTFWEVWDELDRKFVVGSTSDALTDREKMDGAIEGLVGSYGDPYTMYLPPKKTEMFEEDISGNFEGVGMEIGERDEVLTVIAPLPQSPAMEAGILPGDAIVRIDDEPTDRMNIDEAVEHIRGEKGTEVVLTIYREGEAELLIVPVVRDTINIPTLETSMESDVFIIKLFNFSAVSEARVEEALREYARSGSEKLIFDVRGNPGGFLQSAVGVASYFLPAGKVVVREHFGDTEEERLYRSQGRTLGQYAPEEMVVLVDGGSASASEILAGALQEHGVATVIGSQTFGKGSVQELVSFKDGSSLKVTIARWLTPDGVSISEGGLTPDVVVERTIEDWNAGRDPQLEAAIEYLNR